MNPAQVDLKQTINLPRTDFSMKANLPQAEPKMLARWEAEDLYGADPDVARGQARLDSA